MTATPEQHDIALEAIEAGAEAQNVTYAAHALIQLFYDKGPRAALADVLSEIHSLNGDVHKALSDIIDTRTPQVRALEATQ